MLHIDDFTRFCPVNYSSISWQPYTKDFQQVKYPRSSYIMREGEPESRLFFLTSGLCCVTRLFDDGREYIRYLGGHGSTVGPISSLLHQNPEILLFSTRAYTDCEGYVVGINQIAHLMNDIDFMELIFKSEHAKTHVLNNRLELLAIQNGCARLLALLLGMAACCGQEISPGKRFIPFPLSHQLLGNISMLDRVTISRYMAIFSQLHIVEKRNNRYSILLENIEKNKELISPKIWRR